MPLTHVRELATTFIVIINSAIRKHILLFCSSFMVHRLALLCLLLVEGACQVHDCGQSLQPRGPRAERMQPFELARRRVSNPDLAAGKCKIILKNPLAVCQQLTGRQCCISIGINGVDEGGCACCCSIENAIGLVDARVKIMQHSPCCNKMEPRCKSICDKVGKNMPWLKSLRNEHGCWKA
jgi:hypothetical protein